MIWIANIVKPVQADRALESGDAHLKSPDVLVLAIDWFWDRVNFLDSSFYDAMLWICDKMMLINTKMF